MRARMECTAAVTVAAMLAVVLVGAAPARAQQPHPGKAVYDRWCAECHGLEGRGDGSAAAYMLPRPRDFTQARYQIRSTASGALPTDADILRIIDRGMPGTAMPGWPKLSKQDRANLVAYLKTFSRFFESEGTPQPLSFGKAPRASDESIAEGKRLYDQLECWKCHGRAGRGDGPSAPTQEDDNGYPIRPANLAQNWLFNGGGSVEDIYARLRTGIDGTPMPSFSDLLDSNIITNDQLWSIAHYVRSLSPRKAPVTREVIRAALTDELPATNADEAWEQAEPFYIPLVGQIIVRPRMFAPTVTGVWVQALHDGEALALRLTWDDPSRSPAPAWEEWRAAIAQHVEPGDDAAFATGAPDAFAVQFPSRTPGGRDLPYFLMGDARNPVYLWAWSSDAGVREVSARGIGRFEPLPQDGAPVQGEAKFGNGRWQLVLRRALEAQDTARRITFARAEPVPIAFFAWDGSNGEAGARGSISSWYFVHLEQPVTASVYATPVLAALVTAALGLLLVRRAQRQHAAAPVRDGAVPQPRGERVPHMS